MKANTNLKQRGFTLIEIVLVLAIAGLIFVIVFLAVSQAQASRRDTQRKNDLNRIAAQAEQYASNKRGDYPTEAMFTSASSESRVNFIATEDLRDPMTGNDYTYQANYTTTSCDSAADGTVYYDLRNTGGRIYDMRMCLEGGVAETTNE